MRERNLHSLYLITVFITDKPLFSKRCRIIPVRIGFDKGGGGEIKRTELCHYDSKGSMEGNKIGHPKKITPMQA